MSYRIVKITSFYRDYLSDYYERKPLITQQKYDVQLSDLMEEGFAWADFFAQHLRKLGNEAFEIVRNAEPMQLTWASENDVKTDNILLYQLKKIKPEVVFFQDTISYSSEFIKDLRKEVPSIRLIIAHVCSPYSNAQLDLFKSFDFVLVCSPGFQKYFNRHGIMNFLFYHGFEQSLLPKITDNNNFSNNEILFVGSFIQSETFHDQRLKLVESILEENLPLSIYSKINQQSFFNLKFKQAAYLSAELLKLLSLQKFIRSNTILRKSALLKELPGKQQFSANFYSHLNNKAVYGIEMLKLLQKSKICLNNHGGISGEYAANIRMFEVTGAGSLLLTDNKINIRDLFEPDKEVITYDSHSECISKLKWLLENPVEIGKVARAGHERTLKSHTLEQRVEYLNELILQKLKY